MFLHPESHLDLVRLEQAERDRHLDQHLHFLALRERRSQQTASPRAAVTIRPRLARALRDLANRLQPAPESPSASISPLPSSRASAAPRPLHVQRLRQHARAHAMAIAHRHDAHHIDAA